VPYPWAEELGLDEPRQDAQLFCVRDWTEGSAGEKAAKEAKLDLEGKLKAQLLDGIARLREQLAVKAAVPSGLQEKLVQVKPGLFAAVQQKRELAEASARQERQRNVLEILGGLGQKKKRLVSLKVTQPDDLEKAVKDYDKLLSDQVNRVQSLKEDLDKKNQAAQARSMELKKQVEEALQHASEKWSSDVQPALEEAKTAPEDLEKAVQLRDRLKKELEKLSKTEERIKETLRLAEAGAKEADGGKRRLASLAASEADTSQELTQLEEAIEKLNEHIGQQFPQETRLLKDLEELTAASARNSGFSTEIEELQKVLNSLSESSGKASGKP
jgi:chromosome segregation ATPase